MTVPGGHSHPLTIQTRGQGTGPVLLHVRWQLGCEAHSLRICPLMGQAVINVIYLNAYSSSDYFIVQSLRY